MQSKAELRERFRKVILSAGYKNPEPILEEWFEKLSFANEPLVPNAVHPEFIEMLESYEASDGDPL